MRVTANNEVLILQSVNHPDTIDQIVLLSAENNVKLDIAQGNLGYSTLFYYKDKGGIVLHSGSGNQLYFLGLTEAASTEKLGLIKANKTLNGEVRPPLFGFGLSVMKGKWDKKTLIESKNRYAVNLLTLADHSGNTSPAAKTAAAADAPFTCTSGGPNSTSCSITEVLGISCSVTCSDGYYACCNSSSTRCICVRNGSNPGPVAVLWGQCGGYGWTGPIMCVAGSLCVYVNDFYSQCQPG